MFPANSEFPAKLQFSSLAINEDELCESIQTVTSFSTVTAEIKDKIEDYQLPTLDRTSSLIIPIICSAVYVLTVSINFFIVIHQIFVPGIG